MKSSESKGSGVGFKFFPLDYAAMVGFLAYSSSVTAVPICLVAITRELDLSLSQGGGLEAGRGILVLVTLLFSGFIAARFGKARSIGVGSLVLGAGMLVYGVAPSYGSLFIAVSMLGFGGGVVEALINPLVQELHPNDSGRYLNLINAFWSIGVLATMLGTGQALNESVPWRSVMVALGGLSFLSGVLFLLLRGKSVARSSDRMATVLADKRQILADPRFWIFTVLMFLGGAAEGAFTYWGASLMQLEYHVSPRSAGVGVALFAGGMIVARLLFGWLVPQRLLWHLLFFSTVGGLLVGIGFPLGQSIALANVNLFLAGVAVACFWPTLQAYAVDRMKCDPTSGFILLSCGGIAGFASVSLTMGWLGDWMGLKESFWIVPVYLFLMALVLLVERRRTVSET